MDRSVGNSAIKFHCSLCFSDDIKLSSVQGKYSSNGNSDKNSCGRRLLAICRYTTTIHNDVFCIYFPEFQWNRSIPFNQYNDSCKRLNGKRLTNDLSYGYYSLWFQYNIPMLDMSLRCEIVKSAAIQLIRFETEFLLCRWLPDISRNS